MRGHKCISDVRGPPQCRNGCNWSTTGSSAKALLAMTATCFLSRNSEPKKNARLCTNSVWSNATPFRTKEGRSSTMSGTKITLEEGELAGHPFPTDSQEYCEQWYQRPPTMVSKVKKSKNGHATSSCSCQRSSKVKINAVSIPYQSAWNLTERGLGNPLFPGFS